MSLGNHNQFMRNSMKISENQRKTKKIKENQRKLFYRRTPHEFTFRVDLSWVKIAYPRFCYWGCPIVRCTDPRGRRPTATVGPLWGSEIQPEPRSWRETSG